MVILVIGILLLACLAAISFEVYSNPLRRSVISIRENALKAVPIGSNEEALKMTAKAKGWHNLIRFKAQNHKLGLNDGSGMDPGIGSVDGEILYRVNLGNYSNLFKIYVESYWIFNADGKLTELRIQKELDAL